MRNGISFQVAYAISRPGIKPAPPNIGCCPAMEDYLKTVEPRFCLQAVCQTTSMKRFYHTVR